MKTVKIVIITGLMALVNLAIAQPPGNNRGDRNNEREFRQQGHTMLNLSDDQRAKAETLRLNMQKSALPIRNQLGENRAKMRTLTTAENPDMKAINKLIDENAKLRADLAKHRAANHQEFRKMLTEEQRVKFDSRAGQGFHQRGNQQGERQHQGQRGQSRHFKGHLE